MPPKRPNKPFPNNDKVPPELQAIRSAGDPQVKVILVKDDMGGLQEMFQHGWKTANAYTHPRGVVMVMVREAADRLK